jgi:hypothetical protein
MRADRSVNPRNHPCHRVAIHNFTCTVATQRKAEAQRLWLQPEETEMGSGKSVSLHQTILDWNTEYRIPELADFAISTEGVFFDPHFAETKFSDFLRYFVRGMLQKSA